MPARLLVISLLMIVAAPLLAEDKQKKPAERRHDGGPLTADDFRGTRPDDATTDAWTEADLRYHFNYRYFTDRGVTTATLAEIEVWAVILTEKSWNRRPKNALLLDHEQGHFDLMQIYALKGQLRLQRNLGDVKALRGKGKNSVEAGRDLEKSIVAVLEEIIAEARAVNIEYDKETSRGTNVRAQANARKAHREQMLEVLTEIEKLSAKK